MKALGYDVVAIDDEGVYITDGTYKYKVADHDALLDRSGGDHGLANTYAETIEG